MDLREPDQFSFPSYAERFRTAAQRAGRDEKYIAACLVYAARLASRKLPIIYDAEHLAALLGYELDYVADAAHGGRKFYRQFTVKKRNGGTRVISEPLPSLKEIQRWVLDNILSALSPHRNAKGFIRGRSIKDNARFHRRQDGVLALDLKDFFPSIKRHRVYGLFRSLGYSQPVSNLLARLCCLDDALPQGAPSSPAISNIVCVRFDRRLAGFARKMGLRYTRYADDLTFSGKLDAGDVLRFVEQVAAEHGFAVHPDKIRLMGRHQRQIVTGIVVNDGLHAPRSMRRRLRQAVYHIKKFGLASHLEQIGESRANYLRHLIGLAGFVVFVAPDDSSAALELAYLQELLEAPN